MRNLKQILLLLFCVGFVFACSEIVNEDTSEDLKSAKMGKDKNTQMVTVPFKADFVGNYRYELADPEACDPFWFNVVNDGGGTATHLGKFTHYFSFCVDTLSYYPGSHMEAWFVAANGDTLFVFVSGQVLDGRLDHHPEDVNSYFIDPWVIERGTGRFEGATGQGWTDDYNRSAYPMNSFHHWRGTITMPKDQMK